MLVSNPNVDTCIPLPLHTDPSLQVEAILHKHLLQFYVCHAFLGMPSCPHLLQASRHVPKIKILVAVLVNAKLEVVALIAPAQMLLAYRGFVEITGLGEPFVGKVDQYVPRNLGVRDVEAFVCVSTRAAWVTVLGSFQSRGEGFYACKTYSARSTS